MLQRVRRFLALDSADRRLLTRAFIGLAITDVALRSIGFAHLAKRLTSLAAAMGTPGPMMGNRPRRYAYWLEVASRHHVVRARCLHRSLVLHQWLLHDGIPSRLQIGVRKHEGVLHAHAWVEIDGQAVNEQPSELAAFTPLSSSRRIGGRHANDSGAAPTGVIDLWWRHGAATWQ